MNSSSSGSRPNGSNTPANSNRQNTTSQGNNNRPSGGYNSGNRDSNYRGAGNYSSGGAPRTGGYQQGGYNNRSRSPGTANQTGTGNQAGTGNQTGTAGTASASSTAAGTAGNSNFNRRPSGQSNYGGSGGGYNPNYSRPAGQSSYGQGGNYGGGSYGSRSPGAGGGYQKREYGNRREGPPEAHRINSRITAREVRVVSESGEQLGVLPTHQALEIAQRDGYDLVEVAPQANPPVCKIMDYGKFKYREQKKEAEAKKKRTESTLKELRIRYRTDSGDLETKLKQAREFFEEGDKVKFSMRFKGREAAFIDLGVQKFDQIVERLADVASVDERSPAFGKQIHITFAPLKTAAAPKPKKPSHESTDKSAKSPNSDTMAAKLAAATQKSSEDKSAEQTASDTNSKE